jgi:hypothetical protein
MLKVEGERGQEGGKGEGGVTVRAGRDGIFSSCLAHVIEREGRVADGRSNSDKHGRFSRAGREARGLLFFALF